MTEPSPSRVGRLARAALTVSVGGAVSRLLGLGREQTIAALFGRSAATDAFTAASRIPTTTYDLLVGGMISAAFVPVLSSEAERDERAFQRLAGLLLSFFGALLAAAVALVLLFSAPIVAVLTPFFDAETQATTLHLLRLMTPSLFFLGMSGVAIGILQARRQFGAPAFGAAVFNLGFIVAAWALRDHGVEALALALLAGSVAQLVLQAAALRSVRLQLSFDWRTPQLRRIGALYLPVLLGLIVTNTGVYIDTILASSLPPGDLTAMRYATTLTQLTLGVVAVSIGTAYLPELSRMPAASPQYRAALGEALRAVLLLAVPLVIALAVLREPVIRLLFERGAFTSSDTARTALAYLAYAPGTPAAALDQILIFAFYARQDTIRPVLVGVASVGIYLAVALALVQPFGMVGLTLANSAQWIGHLLMMALLTALMLRALPLRASIVALGRIGLAGSAAGLTWWLAGWVLPADALLLVPAVVVAGAAGGAVYLGTLLLLGAPEASFLIARLRSFLDRAFRRK
ncbi:MAG: murein biosynthesis integral membrane protein MurJ [Chloroflexota bacterium]|nr:murein biosynthesis integral membrane protein MurJ [Dehalococcoidia bacterium]MDW8254049.1 murein biosynthesis integral membrane protein MurJ [Chloroflexota bacterium]